MKKLPHYLLTIGLSLSGITFSDETAAASINTAQIMASSASTSCMEYQTVGICYWLYCSYTGCRVRTSVKVRHFLPEQVVSAYNHGGQNPWKEIKSLGKGIDGGDYQDKPHTKQYSQLTFKNVDVIGHPLGAITQLLSKTGYYCKSQSFSFKPHFLSGLDVLAWRAGIPESFYPEAITPGMREIGGLDDMWGNIYPRAGNVTQVHPYKAAAVTAQRAADIISRSGQLHIYIPAAQKAQQENGWWPPPPVKEGDERSHKWQMLTPKMEKSCAIFPDRNATDAYADKHSVEQDYAWALWRPYSCCKRRGQKFLFSTDFR